jgi:hypothetical protein
MFLKICWMRGESRRRSELRYFGMRCARVAFVRVVSNPPETRKVLVEMVQQARSQTE